MYMVLLLLMFILNYSTLVDPLLSDIRKFTLNFAGMNAGDKVLDVCCGTGEQVLEYGMHGIIATGIDIDPNMLNIALKNRMKRHLENVSFQLADATDLPFPDGHFDYASISFGLHDKKKNVRDRVISEIKRVVKHGGTFIFLDFQVPLPNNVWACIARLIEFLVGGEHYLGFKDYLRSGGLATILKNHHLLEIHRTQLKGGLIVAIEATNA